MCLGLGLRGQELHLHQLELEAAALTQAKWSVLPHSNNSSAANVDSELPVSSYKHSDWGRPARSGRLSPGRHAAIAAELTGPSPGPGQEFKLTTVTGRHPLLQAVARQDPVARAQWWRGFVPVWPGVSFSTGSIQATTCCQCHALCVQPGPHRKSLHTRPENA
jgi:hypothetical protein